LKKNNHLNDRLILRRPGQRLDDGPPRFERILVIAPESQCTALIEEVEHEPGEAIVFGKRDQGEAGYRVETVHVECVQLVQGLAKMFLGVVGRLYRDLVRENGRAAGTSRALGEPPGLQLVLLSFQAMFTQGAHDGSNIGKDAAGLVVSPDLYRFPRF